jgi:hypothetical protein
MTGRYRGTELIDLIIQLKKKNNKVINFQVINYIYRDINNIRVIKELISFNRGLRLSEELGLGVKCISNNAEFRRLGDKVGVDVIVVSAAE